MRFGELYEIPSRNGLTKPRSIRGQGIKFVNMGELFANERIDTCIEMNRVPVTAREFEESLVKPDDLLFARQSLVRDGAGKCSIVHKVTEPATFDSHLIRVRLNKEIACPEFYRYYFSSSLSPIPGIVSQCAQAGIKGSDLKELEVIHPPIAIQREIAGILSSYDDFIENNRKQIKLLEEAAQRLYKEWFIDLKFPGHENVKVVNGVPEGWEKTTVGNLCTLAKEKNKARDRTSSAKYIGLEHMPRKSICLNMYGDPLSIDGDKTIFKKGDILFGKIRPYFHKVGFAQCDGITSTDTLVIRSEPEVFPLLLMCLSSDNFVSYATVTSKTGTKMPRANWEAMARYELLMPDAETLEWFNSTIRFLLEKMCLLSKQMTFAQEARNRLLPRLMSGEIEV